MTTLIIAVLLQLGIINSSDSQFGWNPNSELQEVIINDLNGN